VPTAFLVNGQFNIKGNAAPVRIIVDPSSIELIDDADAQFEKVEIVVIQINTESDLQFKLSLKQLDHLKKLEYIYFSCTLNLCGEDDPTITCEKEQIDRMIEGKYDAEIKVVYTAEISQ
jgi:hypothetical protein